MSEFTEPLNWDGWRGTSNDPNDEQFGDVVEPTTLEEADAYDAVLVGEPFDRAVIGRRGTREGPQALREQLAAIKTHHFDAGPVGALGDLGDVAEMVDLFGRQVVVPTSSVQERTLEVMREVHATDAFPVFLGGDNSLTYPNAAPLLESGSVGVVNFDAHLDVREVREDATSGTPYRQLFEGGLDAYACVGARHFETSTAYHDYLREQGGEVVTAEEVGEDPVAAVDVALAAMDGVDSVYVSVDLDVLDAAHAPGVSAPTPGGVSARELFRMVRLAVSDDRVAGFEVVECAPPLDAGDRTARVGARAVAHALAGRGGGRRA
jgi:formimidoylglutamase